MYPIMRQDFRARNLFIGMIALAAVTALLRPGDLLFRQTGDGSAAAMDQADDLCGESFASPPIPAELFELAPVLQALPVLCRFGLYSFPAPGVAAATFPPVHGPRSPPAFP